MMPLGFTVSAVKDELSLREVRALRSQAYGRHLPDQPAMSEALARPDPSDLAAHVTVLACRDKASGDVVGTARIQRNHPQPLPIEASVALPAPLAAQTRAEVTRLAIRCGADPLVRQALFKSCWMLALAGHIHNLVIGARSAPLVRIYKSLGFVDVLADENGSHPVPLAHAGGLLHHVLALDVAAAEPRWHARRHPWYEFMVETWHPDLHLLPGTAPVAPAQALLSLPALPRATPAQAAPA
ncbi:MAG: hypothetical protein LCI02_03300 [Proteobacteria bacterium]|nr:hypothetical protein [Pseudomonadota bacterium]